MVSIIILVIVDLLLHVLSFILISNLYKRTDDKKQTSMDKANRVLSYAKEKGIKNPYIADLHNMIGLYDQDNGLVFVADMHNSEQKIRRLIKEYIKTKEKTQNDEVK